jgi:hypothetical protein
VIDFVDMRDEAVEQIKTAFLQNDKLHVAAHPGRFDEKEIKRLASRTPAILTSFLRYSDEVHSIDFVTWVLYRATGKDPLYDGALKIVSALMPVIRNVDAEWSMGGGGDIEAECLYTGSLDQINITLWGIKWSWKIRETVFCGGGGVVTLPGSLEYFEGYDAAHAVGGDVVKDTINLEVENGNSVKTNSG